MISYNIHDVVRIETTHPIFNEAFHRYFQVDSLDGHPDIRLDLDASLTSYDTAGLYRHDIWYYGDDDADVVFYEDRIFGQNDKVLLRGLFEKTTTIRADTISFATPGSRGSILDLVESVIDYKLLQRGYTTIHAASLSKHKKSVLLAGFPNVGKTLSTLYLLQSGFAYMGDDNGVVGEDGTVYAYPSTSSIGYHDFVKYIRPEDVGRATYWKHLLRVWPMRYTIIERLLDFPEIYLPDIGRFNQGDTAEASVVCTLEIGPRQVVEVHRSDMVNKIASSTDYSRPRIWQNPFFQVHDYFNEIDMIRLQRREREILSSFVSDASCKVLSCEQRNWDSVLHDLLEEVVE